MMSSLDFRCELRIVNRGRLVRGKDACTNAIAMHVGFQIVAYMFQKNAMNVCVYSKRCAGGSSHRHIELFHDIHD